MVYWCVLYMAPKRAVWMLRAKIATEVSRPAAGARVVTCGCSEKLRNQAPELRRPWPPSHVRDNRSAFAWALRPLGAIPKPRWRRDSSYVRSVVQRGAFAAASAAAARRTSSHAPQPLTERWCASSATMQAAVLQPRPSRGAARRIGKPSTARSAALGGGGQPAHPLPPSSRTAAFRGSLRATRAPRSAAVGQPFG